MNCWKCGASLTASDYGRQDSCAKCGVDTHACLNCVNHHRSYNNECIESQADRVVDKEKSNFCDWFKPRASAGEGAPSKDALKAAAEALFKLNKKN